MVEELSIKERHEIVVQSGPFSIILLQLIFVHSNCDLAALSHQLMRFSSVLLKGLFLCLYLLLAACM